MHGIARDSLRNQQAMTVIQPQITTPEETPDDMTAETLCLVSISLAATYIGSGGDASMLAIPGAMLAALVALLKATHEKRIWQDKASSVIGTSVVGSTAPSVVVHYFWPESYSKLIWQAWALFGFLGGLVGWIIAWAFVKVIGLRSEELADSAVSRFKRRLQDRIGTGDSKSGSGVKRQNGSPSDGA